MIIILISPQYFETKYLKKTMKLFIAVFFGLIFTEVVAEPRIDSLHYNIQYRDTSGTFLQIYAVDSNTGEEIPEMLGYEFVSSNGTRFKYFRVLNALNISEITRFAPDIYSIRDQYYLHKNVDIKRNKINIIKFFIPQAKLIFGYADNKDSAVINRALVTKRLCKENCSFIQNCGQSMMYPPGDYQVIINTIPPSEFNITLDFASTYLLQIPMPCSLLVSNIAGLSSIELYFQKSDEWKLCKAIDTVFIKDNPLLLQPSNYLIVWKKNGKVFEKEIILRKGKTIEFTFEEWD